MSRALLWGGVAAVALVAGVVWFSREPTTSAGQEDLTKSGEAQPQTITHPAAQTRVAGGADARLPVPTDARLAALMDAPGNPLVEYVPGPGGRVILEIDNNPSNPGYRKPLREYSYAGDQLAALTVFRYVGDQVQITRAIASYKSDGSVDEYRETTEFQKAGR